MLIFKNKAYIIYIIISYKIKMLKVWCKREGERKRERESKLSRLVKLRRNKKKKINIFPQREILWIVVAARHY